MRSTEGPRVLWQGARGSSAQIDEWILFIRAADAFYAGLAQQRGEPYTPAGQGEIEAAAALAVALDLTPADAMEWLPPVSRK
ncbi:MAG: hypothetical protein AB7R89_13245 [Dehalococcoidia bacterium]